MAVLSIKAFHGIVKSGHPDSLPPPFASLASNIRPPRGMLEQMLIEGETLSNRLPADDRTTLYRYRYRQSDGTQAQVWLSFEKRTHVVGAPLADDSHDRVYWTAPGEYPRMADRNRVLNEDDTTLGTDYPERSYGLGIPAPVTSPTPTLQTPVDSDQRVYDVAYVYTLVDQFGAEGPPSPASRVLTRNDDSAVNVAIPDIPPPVPVQNSGESNADFAVRAAPINRFRTLYARAAFGAGARVRVYRANAGTDQAVYQYVAEAALPFNDPIVDDQRAFALGEALPSLDWYPPPDLNTDLYPDGPLQNLTVLPGGVLAGSSGRGVFFSVPGLPHAWPPDWRVVVDDDIVALRAVASGLVVLTTGRPYLIGGTDPASMAAERIEFPQACLSEESVVDMGGWIMYMSPDGVAQLDGVRGRLATGDVVPRETWRTNYVQGAWHGFLHEGAAVFLRADPSAGFTPPGVMLHPDLPGLVHLSYQDASGNNIMAGGWSDPEDGSLTLIYGQNLVRFADGAQRVGATNAPVGGRFVNPPASWRSHWVPRPDRPAFSFVLLELDDISSHQYGVHGGRRVVQGPGPATVNVNDIYVRLVSDNAGQTWYSLPTRTNRNRRTRAWTRTLTFTDGADTATVDVEMWMREGTDYISIDMTVTGGTGVVISPAGNPSPWEASADTTVYTAARWARRSATWRGATWTFTVEADMGTERNALEGRVAVRVNTPGEASSMPTQAIEVTLSPDPRNFSLRPMVRAVLTARGQEPTVLQDSTDAMGEWHPAIPGGWPPLILPIVPTRAARVQVEAMVWGNIALRNLHLTGSREEAVALAAG